MILDATGLVTKPDGNRPQDPSRLIGIAIHHTVGRNTVENETDERATIVAIDRQHVAQHFGGFGYHGIVFPSGRAYRCGEGQRAHVKGRNHELRGWAFSGTFTNELPTEAAFDCMREVLLEERARFGPLPIMGHREWALPGEGTACPGIIVPRDWEALLQEEPMNEDGWQKKGKQMVLVNEGVEVLKVGDEAGEFPGRIAKNFGGEWHWLRLGRVHEGNWHEATWNPTEGD